MPHRARSFRASATRLTLATAILGLLLLPALSQASGADDLIVELARPASFVTLADDFVEIAAGSYALLPLADGLRVARKEGEPIDLSIAFEIHEEKLPGPMAVSVAGDPKGESADRHRLAVLLPNGLIYVATGSYSGVRTRDDAAAVTDPMQASLEKAVAFDAPGGEDVVVAAGSYRVERDGASLRLLQEGQAPVVVAAESDTYDSTFEVPVVLSLPGEAEAEADLHFLVLLLPDGERLTASGEVVAIGERGIIGDIGKGVKKGTKSVKKGVKKGTRKLGKTVKSGTQTAGHIANRTRKDPIGGLGRSAKDVGKLGYDTGKTAVDEGKKAAEKAALEAKKKAEWVAKKAAEAALAVAKAACMAAIETLKLGMEATGKLTSAAMEETTKTLKPPNVQKQLKQVVDAVLGERGAAILKTMEAASILSSPKSIKKLAGFLDSDSICGGTPKGDVMKVIRSMAGKEIESALSALKATGQGIIPRGGMGSKTFSLTAGGDAGTGPVGGELGFRFATNFGGQNDFFIDLAYMFKVGASSSGGLVVGFFPWTAPKESGGPYTSISVGFDIPGAAGKVKGAPVGAGSGLELVFYAASPNPGSWRWIGVQIPIVAGGGVKPVEGNFKVGHGFGPL